MIRFRLIVSLMTLFSCVLSPIPAPVNVTVTSLNYKHVLRWDPGLGTPPGTEYKIYRRVNKKRTELKNPDATRTWYKLKLRNVETTYYLSVQAKYNQTLSPESNAPEFIPFRDTEIGPPELSLAGCGDCLKVDIVLPKPDNNSNFDGASIQKFYDADFKIRWRKADEQKIYDIATTNTTFVLNNLEASVEYCVQVHTRIRTNPNSKPSDWKCEFTSVLEPSRVPVVLGVTTFFLITTGLAVMIVVLGLYYTGFLCKLKIHLPHILKIAPAKLYTLTPERASFNEVSITSKNHKLNEELVGEEEEDDDEEEEEEEEEEEKEGANRLYMDRAEEMDTSSSIDYDASSSSVPISGNSSNLGVILSSQQQEGKVVGRVSMEVWRVEGQLNKEDDRKPTSSTSDGGEKDILKNPMCVAELGSETTDDVNLSSVIFGAKEEENTRGASQTYDLNHSDQMALLHTDLHRSSGPSRMESNSKLMSDYPRLLPSEPVSQQVDCQSTYFEYEWRHADNTKPSSNYLLTPINNKVSGETTDEEEEEEHSGYMGR